MEEKDVEKMRREIKSLSQRLEVIASQQGEDMEEEVQGKIASMRTQLKDLYAKTKIAGVKAQNFVEENPWKAVGIATLVGLVIGIMISGKKRHD